MFTFLNKHLLYTRNPTITYPSLLIRLISSNSNKHNNSFTVAYLMNTCGFTQEKAISASKQVHFETPIKPDSVLTVLRNHGFTNTHISKIIHLQPKILLLTVNTKLKPKLEFLETNGLSGTDLVQALSNNPYILGRSLEKAIIPSFDFIKTLIHNKSALISVLKYGMNLLLCAPQSRLVPNVQHLRANGVPDYNIQLLFTQLQSYRLILQNPRTFKKSVENVKNMKVDPSLRQFVFILKAFASKESWEAKLDVYRKWGWSDEEILCALKTQPSCMMLSEKNIMSTMEYLVNKAGYDPLLIAKTPSVLLYSLQRRIIPRCSVIQLLIANGLVHKHYKLGSLFVMNEKKFLKDFVAKFEKKMPEVVNVYHLKGGEMV